jgi:hypothetical protein
LFDDFGGKAKFKELWNKFKQCDAEFVLCNLFDADQADSLIARTEGDIPFVYYSNIFSTDYTLVDFTLEEVKAYYDEFIAKILKSDEQARVEARAYAQLQARTQAQLQLKRLVPNTMANTVQRQVKHFKEQKLFVSCYFNEPFKIDFNTNTSNIKACSDSIRLGMNTKYSNIKDFLLYQTFSKNIFVVAYNNKDDENSNYTGTIHVEVNKHFNTSDINEIKNNDIDMYKEIMNTLQSITPKLSFEKPEGMKMIIIYIKDFKSSNPLYKFIRVFVTNKKTDTYGDYAI